MFLKKHGKSRTVCSEIIIYYDSEKAYKDYNTLSTMYKNCKKNLISPVILFFISHVVFQRVNNTQNLLINNEKS